MKNKNMQKKDGVNADGKALFILTFALLLMPLFLLNSASAKDFVIYNNSNTAQNYFYVNGTTGQTWINLTNISGQLYLFNSKCAAGYVLTTDTTTGLVSCTDASSLGGLVNGSGTSGYIPMWNSSNTLNNSVIYQNGTNIGIGTTSPGSTLQVQGSAGSELAVTNSASGAARLYVGYDSTGGGGIRQGLQIYRNYGDPTIYFNTTQQGSNIAFTNVGNVGINTTTPQNTLNVVGDGNITGNLYGGTVYAGGSAILTTGGSTGYYMDTANGAYRSPNGATNAGYYFQSYNGGTTLMYVGLTGNYAGNVGIGTTSPVAKLYINTTGTGDNLDINRDSTSSNGFVKFITGSNNEWILGERNTIDSNFHLYNYGLGADALVVLNGSGNVGIGTTSPTANLEVSSNVNSSGDTLYVHNTNSGTGASARFDLASDNPGNKELTFMVNSQAASGTSFGINNAQLSTIFDNANTAYTSGLAVGVGTNKPFYLVQNGVPALTINNSGNVGIGTTSPAQKLSVNGNLRIDSASSGYAEGLSINAPTDVQNYSGISFHNAPTGAAYSNSTIKWSEFFNYTPEGGVGSPSGGFAFIQGNANTRLFLASGGNVGIGTTTPQNLLNVLGDANVTGNIYVGSSGSNSIQSNGTCMNIFGSTSEFSIC